MKKILLAGVALCSLGAAKADIMVTAAPQLAGDTLTVSAVSLSDVMTKSRRDLQPAITTTVVTADFTVPTTGTEPQRYDLRLGSRRATRFYASPTDKINVSIAADGSYLITGTPMLDQVAVLQEQLKGPYADYSKALENNDEAAASAANAAADKILVEYVKANPGMCGATWAVLNMEDENLLQYAPTLTGDATTCLLYPMLQNSVKRAETRQAAEKQRAEMEAGHVKAPDFALPDLDGKTVKLSSFKGKWVILDFWGSWCPWCIKGFPGLKSSYEKYKGKLEIIGVNCNDPEANWRAAVKKYALPWVNVYNAQTTGGVMEAYGVQAFPTKVLINPKGQIQKIYVGEDPAFYTDLDTLIK